MVMGGRMTHSAHGRMPDAEDGAGVKKTQLGPEPAPYLIRG